jgi:hypothetical protein
VALQPITPILPWPVANSVRAMDVTAPIGSTGQFTNVNPITNNPTPTFNALQNFGWEYVWHCHILGHEENDMMRPIIFQVPPAAPLNLTAANDSNIPAQVNLSWMDNSASETGFLLQRDISPAFTSPTNVKTVPASGTLNAAGEGTSWGGVLTTTDTPGSGNFFYRIQAVDNGWTGTYSQTWNSTLLANVVSAWSNPASVGTAPSITLSPTSLIFANQSVNTTSVAQAVTLSNAAGAGVLAVTGITFTGNAGDFAQTNNCGASLAAGATCTINVAFRPASSGARAATMAIASSNPTALAVSLTGTGVAPAISPDNNAYQFGSITVGTTSAPQTMTLKNVGNAPLIINGFGLSGGNTLDFASTSTCPIGGTGLPVGITCTVSMTFTPKAIGSRSSILVVSSNDPVTPALNISLSGVGTQSVAALSATSLTFPVQLVNTTSAVQTVTLSNTGNIAFTLTSIVAAGANAGDYTANYTCPIGGAGLAPGANCAINVTFRPLAAGARSATVNVVTTANLNPTPTIALSGTGTQVNISTQALTFAPQVVGTNSASQQVTLTNTGPAVLAITPIAIAGTNPGDFTQTTNCPANLNAGASCRITATFRPTAAGVRSAVLNVTTNDPGTPARQITMTGTATQAAVALTPTSHDFGGVTAKGNSTPFVFTLTNSGTALLTINNIAIGGADASRFNRTTTCGGTLAVGASCTIRVTFSPQKAGTAYNATLQVSDNAPGSPQTATLTGTGQ